MTWIIFTVLCVFSVILIRVGATLSRIAVSMKTKRSQFQNLGWVIWAFTALIIIISYLTYSLFQLHAKPPPNNPNEFPIPFPNEFGDAFGGILNPLVAILVAGLTFLAFWVQYQANLQQRRDITHERFENRFYEMIRLHRENVNEINIAGKHSGRKAFVRMYHEFRIIYNLIQLQITEVNQSTKPNDPLQYNTQDITELSYIILFFGVGEISDKGSEYYVGRFDSDLVKSVLDLLKDCQKYYSIKKNNEWQEFTAIIGSEKKTFEVDFYPFDGHVSKLGHYFRHLYQTIKLAAVHPALDSGNIDDELAHRYEYVKLLRVQLSNHEQALIYFNSFFVGGHVWWGDDTIKKKTSKNGQTFDLSYFLDFGMIKNLPHNLTEDIGPNPIQEFTKRLLQRGYSTRSEEEVNSLKARITELFEWPIDDETFNTVIRNPEVLKQNQLTNFHFS